MPKDGASDEDIIAFICAELKRDSDRTMRLIDIAKKRAQAEGIRTRIPERCHCCSTIVKSPTRSSSATSITSPRRTTTETDARATGAAPVIYFEGKD